jgi:hypothetical protein
LPDHALCGGSKIVPQYLVEALASEFGHRGTLDDVANAAEYLAIDLAGFVRASICS